MSALAFKLLLYLCVWSSILQANGIQNLRYPTRFDNNPLRLGKRQDFLTKSRFFMWKPPALNSGQMYPNVKTQAVPLNFNRYGIPSPPQMAPIHHNYMFTIPTKVNYPSYQPVKEIDDKRKPGNLHHITIINAIMPKPYLPTVPTHSHPTTTFRNYRTNNKLLYHQYYNNNFGRQNMENLNNMNVQQLQLQQLQQQQQQQQQQQHLQMIYPSTPIAFKVSTPTMEYRHVLSYNTKSNNNIEHEDNEINTQVSQCGRKTKNDTNQSASDVLYYYCNNRITNYKNPTQQQTLVSIQPTTSTSTSTTTTTTTTETPPTTPHSTKSARLDFDSFTTERPIFLPTPNSPMENSFTPITSTTIQQNSIVDSDNDNNFKLQRQKYRPKKYEDIRPPQQRHRQTATRYDDIKRQQQQYTTAAAATYDDMKFHSFFTIEDAVTRAPEMQVFNDPYQAYRHARRHHHSHQRQTTTTTIKPDTTTTTKKLKYKSFFDDLDEEDYIIPEVNQYDYSLFSTPSKSVYHKSKIHNELQFSENNQILEHTHKPTEENAFFAVDEPFQGKPKIKQHNFGLFNAIGSTTYTTPAITTYKPYENLRNLFLTTHKIPSSSSAYDSKPITFTSTTETVLSNQEPITERERENTTFDVFSNEVRTSTIIPITTTTEKKSNRIILKSPLNLRSPTTFKYPKQSRIHKSYKNMTSTTTRATPTLKKVPKYQRQYKSKKLKQFKHLFTTSSTTTSTTTTAIPTTTEIPTKRISVRLIPTTSITEEPTTKKAVITRTVSTTEKTKIKKLRQQPSPTTEKTNRNKIKSRTSTASTTAAVSDISIRRQSPRRGSKRANIARNEKETVQPTTRKTENKSRRRPTSSSTTTKPLITRTSSNLSTTSTTSSTPMSTSLRTSSTTTTMKSIMRIANSKSRTKLHNNIKTPTKPFKELKDDRQVFDERMSLMSITSTMANIPPLPIEIYFKKSHSAKM